MTQVQIAAEDTRLPNAHDYPDLNTYVAEVKPPSRDVIGRENELEELMASMNRPELSNVLLIAPPGSGKTALVQAAKMHDNQRTYLEVDLSRMIAGVPHPNELASRIKNLFDEVVAYHEQEGQELFYLSMSFTRCRKCRRRLLRQLSQFWQTQALAVSA